MSCFHIHGAVDLMSCETVCQRFLLASAQQAGRIIEGNNTLEYLEVLQVCILRIYIKLHPGHWDIEVDAVENLTESRTVEAL